LATAAPAHSLTHSEASANQGPVRTGSFTTLGIQKIAHDVEEIRLPRLTCMSTS